MSPIYLSGEEGGEVLSLEKEIIVHKDPLTALSKKNTEKWLPNLYRGMKNLLPDT